MTKHHKATTDTFKMSPFQLGQRFFNDGRDIESNPYLLDANSAYQFNKGYRLAKDAQAARTQPHAG